MPNEKAIVWAVQENMNDYSPAEEFGTVRFITTVDSNPLSGSKANSQVRHDIAGFLSEYIPGKDYIIPCGNPVTIFKVAVALGRTDHNVLKWDGRRNAYIPHKVTLNEIP